VRFKEVSTLYWRQGSKRRALRLLVIAPTAYRNHKLAKTLYRQPAYLFTIDLKTATVELIQAYFDRWQIEVNHREEKTTFGVGQAQVRSPLSVPRQPAFSVAIYAMLLLASLKAYGPQPQRPICLYLNGAAMPNVPLAWTLSANSGSKCSANLTNWLILWIAPPRSL
jgi:hypothetical protein